MRFESVTAHKFGPFRDETLNFGPGMNVVYGRNEAGKSSWHAALYAGLCGLRRGKGAAPKAERHFAESHKPWGIDEWEVGATIELADGRRVELRHDLAGKVDSSALDTSVANRDYASEIIFDGAPDGSRWLGLNRRSFLSTACVRQADILKVRDNPESLQEDMQRAAATAGADATAAAALQRLGEYLKERVGSKRAPTKPLVKTGRDVATARDVLGAAREAHADYVGRRARVEELERAVKDARSRVEAMQAVLAEAEADAFADRLRDVEALSEQFTEGAPHPPPDGGELERRVTEALTTWGNLPVLQELTGPSARELAERIDRLQREVLAARAVVAEAGAEETERRVDRALELKTLFPTGAPRISAAEEVHANQIRDALQEWASLPTLPAPVGPSVEELEQALTSFDRRRQPDPESSRSRRPQSWLAMSVIAALGGVAIALLLPDYGVAGLILAVGGAVGALSLRLAGPRPDANIALALDVKRDGLAQQLRARRSEQASYDAGLRRRNDVIERLRALAELDEEEVVAPDALAQRIRGRQETWRREREAADGLAPQWDELQGLLGGVSVDDLVAEAGRLHAEADRIIGSSDQVRLAELRTKELTGSDLAEIERQADEQRRALEEQRAERLAAEDRQRRDTERIEAATERLREAAAQIGVTDDDADGLASGLAEWRDGRVRILAEAGQRGESWDRLQQLLGERTLDEFAAEAERRRAGAVRLLDGVAARTLAEVREGQPTGEMLIDLQSRAESAREEWLSARGRLAEREKHLPSVADAEDSLAAAEREQARIARLKATLDSTIDFLEQAQERVLRDIAPILTSTVLEWLPRVTQGRYTGCRIDPESLLVEVRTTGGRWRRAELLSHGTAEQVYLLLRFALSRHLTREGETCPLILDDVVGASDAERKRTVLRTLRSLGESTQVILFTHEDDVRDWAKRNLEAPNHRLIELAGPRPETGGLPAT
ncbi:AAA family ATPase [Candidatus Palauibacter sp.]|uniref:AAA family ATPase n=1 Tax=Candidatus Palauibacter sp. TaxID=3101350 RepID=UPI003AF2F4FD